MRDSGQEDLVEVPQHIRERLAELGRRDREARTDVAGLDLCQDRQLADAIEIPRRPVERGGAVLPEAHFLSFAICAQLRVFSTCSFVSHARRACATPMSMCCSAPS